MKKDIRFAVLGANGRAQGLIETWQQHPDITFTAFADIATGRAEEVAGCYNRRYGGSAKAFTSYEEMAAGAVYDAILIACDPDIQVDYACDAMERGVHVITEVPAAYTIEQCWKLVETVRKTGAKYQLSEQTRYWKFIREWRRMARDGAFGKICYAEGEYLHYEPVWDNLRDRKTNYSIHSNDPADFANPDYVPSWRYRTFQNPLYYMPHELSPLLSITGGRIAKVCSFALPQESYMTPGLMTRDLQAALMYTTEDVIFSLRAGFTAPFGTKKGTGAHWYQVKGVRQCVEWARSEIDTPKQYTLEDGWRAREDWTCEDPQAPDYIRNAPHGGADYYPLLYFVEAIQNDTQPPMDVYLAVETAAPAILAVESAKRGGVLLDVPDFRA